MQVILMSDLSLHRSQSGVEAVLTMPQLPHFVSGISSSVLLQPRLLGFFLGSNGQNINHLVIMCPLSSQLFLVQTDTLQKIHILTVGRSIQVRWPACKVSTPK